MDIIIILMVVSAIFIGMAIFSNSEASSWFAYLVTSVSCGLLALLLMEIEKKDQAPQAIFVPIDGRLVELICSPSEDGRDDSGDMTMTCKMASAVPE